MNYFLCVFDIKKQKTKQDKKKNTEIKNETPLAEILFLPGNGARKTLVACALGDPKRKV